MVSENQGKFVALPLITRYASQKMSKKRNFSDFSDFFFMFDPFKKAQKWKLEQILKYTPINIPNGLRKSKKVGSIAIGNQISHPKNVEKTLVLWF